jgi:sugar/nucleoside kinase (ribokinase family)
VTVVGNPGLDTLVLLPGPDLDLAVDTHFVRNVDTVGHAAAFVARLFARMGARVRILGSVGDDLAGRFVTEALATDGVDTGLLFVDPVGTARSVNLIRPDGRRTACYDGGSHMTLQPPESNVDAALADTDLVVSTLANWARHVVARARAGGIPVAVDLQDVRDPTDPYRADFVANADLLLASAAHLADPAAAALAWCEAGPAETVVLGRGAAGAMAVQPHGVVAQPPPDVDLPVIDTTGCGDALAVGVLDALFAHGADLAGALRRGQVLARIVASEPGAQAHVDPARVAALAGAAAPTVA